MICRDAAQSHCEGVSTELAEREAHLEEQLQVRDTALQRDCEHSGWPASCSTALPSSSSRVERRQDARGVAGSDGDVCVPGCPV